MDPDFGLIPFLFGNIDDKGELEDDILDEECKKHINSLSKLGLSSLLGEVVTHEDMALEESADGENDDVASFDVKSPTAEDFSGENEVADEAMPPPLAPVSKPEISDSGENKKLVTPLAEMLPEKYKNVDVREFFPEFRFGQVGKTYASLRDRMSCFSRMCVFRVSRFCAFRVYSDQESRPRCRKYGAV